MTEMITQAQMARLAEVSVKTLQRYVADGKLVPVIKTDTSVMFRFDQLDKVKELWWGGKKSGKAKTARGGSTLETTAAKLARARSRRAKERSDTTGLEDLL